MPRWIETTLNALACILVPLAAWGLFRKRRR